MDIHIGQRIKEELITQGRSVKWLAAQLNCDRTNVHNIFKRNNMDLELLSKISIILCYNFFDEVSADTAAKIASNVENLSTKR